MVNNVSPANLRLDLGIQANLNHCTAAVDFTTAIRLNSAFLLLKRKFWTRNNGQSGCKALWLYFLGFLRAGSLYFLQLVYTERKNHEKYTVAKKKEK